MKLMNLGASILSLETPDREGRWEEITITSDDVGYFVDNPSYLGATVGRFGNRIARGQFELDGVAHQLSTNLGDHHLHGGVRGFTHALWEMDADDVGVTFRLESPAGEEGYPGTVNVTARYTVGTSDIDIAFEATSDAPTIINLTNHTYWNLGGPGEADIREHWLQIFADAVLACDEDILATGELLDVTGTPFDFRTGRLLGEAMEAREDGFDHCFAVSGVQGESTVPVANVEHRGTGRRMRVASNQPGVQLYTSNHFDGGAGSVGRDRYAALCLECQGYPDAPNHPHFPSAVLRPGEVYQRTIRHEFSAS